MKYEPFKNYLFKEVYARFEPLEGPLGLSDEANHTAEPSEETREGSYEGEITLFGDMLSPCFLIELNGRHDALLAKGFTEI